MSVSYRLQPDLGVVCVRYDGHYETALTQELLGLYARDKCIVPGLHSVLDFSRITSAELDVALRQNIMDGLYARLKHPDRDWMLTYYCPNEVSRSLTSMLQKMWQTRAGVDFYVAETIEALAERMQAELDLVKAMVDHMEEGEGKKKGPPILGALSRFSL